VLIFLHNLKTGGTTLRSILARQYRGDQICILGRLNDVSAIKPEMVDDASLRVIEGHVPYGLHAWLPRPAVYVSLLRDPVERIVSLYQFIRAGEGRDIHRETQAALGSLEEFVASGVLLEVDNGQTRRLSGCSPGYGECSEAMLEQAKANIREHFAVVGLTERFDESVLLMGRRFGWRPALYLPEKVNRRKEPAAGLPSGMLELIEQHNCLDRALYEYAAERFERQVAALGPDFQAEVAAFSRLNRELAARDFRKVGRDRGPAGDGEGAPGGAAQSTDPMEMLLEAHASLLAGERTTLRLRHELNAAHTRVRVLTQGHDAARKQVRALEASTTTLERKLLEARERVRLLARERDTAHKRIRALEASKLWRLGTRYRQLRARIASAARLGRPG
jgi:hypothetical protein